MGRGMNETVVGRGRQSLEGKGKKEGKEKEDNKKKEKAEKQKRKGRERGKKTGEGQHLMKENEAFDIKNGDKKQ